MVSYADTGQATPVLWYPPHFGASINWRVHENKLHWIFTRFWPWLLRRFSISY